MWQVAAESGKGHGKGSSVFDSMDRSKQNKLAAATSTRLTPSSAPCCKKVLSI